MFSQRSGMGQSIAGSVIGSIMGYAMQNMMNRGIGSFLHSRGQNKDSMNTALNQIQTETANNPDHQLVQQIKSSTGLQDDNQARQYIQQAVEFMKEHTNNNPEAMHSAFTNYADNQGMNLGGMLSGFGGNSQPKKEGGLGELLGNL
ncbi:MAG: hypothetical protein ABI361_07570 [Nitrososphaera sp.]|jgi:hypothetical protein